MYYITRYFVTENNLLANLRLLFSVILVITIYETLGEKTCSFFGGFRTICEVFSAKFCGRTCIIIGDWSNPRKFSPRNSRCVPKC